MEIGDTCSFWLEGVALVNTSSSFNLILEFQKKIAVQIKNRKSSNWKKSVKISNLQSLVGVIGVVGNILTILVLSTKVTYFTYIDNILHFTYLWEYFLYIDMYLIYIYYYITSFLVFSFGNDNVDFPPHCLWYWSWQYLSAFFAALFSLNVILYVEQSWTIDVPTSAFSSRKRGKFCKRKSEEYHFVGIGSKSRQWATFHIVVMILIASSDLSNLFS